MDRNRQTKRPPPETGVREGYIIPVTRVSTDVRSFRLYLGAPARWGGVNFPTGINLTHCSQRYIANTSALAT